MARVRFWSIVLALVGGCLVTASVTSADDKKKDKKERTTTTTTKTFRVERASQLIGKPVQTETGEALGTVQDLAIDVNNDGRVGYAVVSYKTTGGTSDKWYAVPIHAFQYPDEGKHFVLTVDSNRIKTAEGFTSTQWPRMDDMTWATKVHAFYDQEPYWMDDSGRPTGETTLRIQRAKEIIGRPIHDKSGKSLGKIEDLAIDPDTGRIAYNVVSLEGSTPTSATTTYYAMPSGIVDLSKGDRSATFTVETERFKSAPTFETTRWSTLSDPTFGTTVYEYYGQRPYWTTTTTTRETTTTPRKKDKDKDKDD